MTEEQCREVEREILRLDPERVRLFLDENWVVHIMSKGTEIGWMHPLNFLDLAKTVEPCSESNSRFIASRKSLY